MIKRGQTKLGSKFSLRFLPALSLRQFPSVSLGLDFFINKMCGAEGWWW